MQVSVKNAARKLREEGIPPDIERNMRLRIPEHHIHPRHLRPYFNSQED